jgi:hypothetical protein
MTSTGTVEVGLWNPGRPVLTGTYNW